MNIRLSSRFFIGFIITVGIASAFIRILPWRLDYNDLAKQAYASYDMVEHGAWLVQESPDKMIATKPPLVAWLSAATFLVTRNWPIAWHLPSFAAVVVMLILLWRLLGKGASATFGCLVFLLNHFTQTMVFVIRTDMVLAMFVLMAVGMIYTHLRDLRQWTLNDNMIFFMILLLGMYTKGPVILIFLIPGLLFFLWNTRMFPKEKRPLPAVWVWVAAILGFLFWVILAALLEERFYDQVVIQEFMTRFQPGGATRSRPPGKYFLYFLGRFLPWSLLFIYSLFQPSIRKTIKNHPENRWLLFTCLASWLLLELIPSKRADRMYPLIPVIAWLLAVFYQKTKDEITCRFFRPTWVTGLIVFSVVTQLFYSIYTAVSDTKKGEGELVNFGKQASKMASHHDGRLWLQENVTFHTGMSLYAESSDVVEDSEMVGLWLSGSIRELIVNEEGLAYFKEAGVLLTPVLCSHNQDASESVHYLLLNTP